MYISLFAWGRSAKWRGMKVRWSGPSEEDSALLLLCPFHFLFLFFKKRTRISQLHHYLIRWLGASIIAIMNSSWDNSIILILYCPTNTVFIPLIMEIYSTILLSTRWKFQIKISCIPSSEVGTIELSSLMWPFYSIPCDIN